MIRNAGKHSTPPISNREARPSPCHPCPTGKPGQERRAMQSWMSHVLVGSLGLLLFILRFQSLTFFTPLEGDLVAARRTRRSRVSKRTPILPFLPSSSSHPASSSYLPYPTLPYTEPTYPPSFAPSFLLAPVLPCFLPSCADGLVTETK